MGRASSFFLFLPASQPVDASTGSKCHDLFSTFSERGAKQSRERREKKERRGQKNQKKSPRCIRKKKKGRRATIEDECYSLSLRSLDVRNDAPGAASAISSRPRK